MGQVLNEGDHVEITDAQRTLLAEVADVIIPETDTPGAKEASAHEFIIRVMRDCYELADQEQFFAGLARIDERSQAAYQKPFVDLSRKDQIAIIAETAKKDKGYFKQIKELSQVGYFTSEIGVTRNLQYIPIPGRFEGDVPYEKGQGVIMNAR